MQFYGIPNDLILLEIDTIQDAMVDILFEFDLYVVVQQHRAFPDD